LFGFCLLFGIRFHLLSVLCLLFGVCLLFVVGSDSIQKTRWHNEEQYREVKRHWFENTGAGSCPNPKKPVRIFSGPETAPEEGTLL